jgi:N6-L-threonylcarbamoyladenine synthase
MNILALETSCDETSAAVLKDDLVISNVISSQLFHNRYGGVVPEIASREHTKNIVLIAEEALKQANLSINDIELITATTEPGLIGALLVGMNFGKALAASADIPFVPVNHIHAHIYSNFLGEEKPDFPFLSLVVSGGHTLLVKVDGFFNHQILGSTIDDAAGEAFDKVAKMLGLGYPGGPIIDKLAKEGDPVFHKFPLSRLKTKYDFSFSGIKTSVLYYLRDIKFNEMADGDEKQKLVNNICASFQKTMIDMLVNNVIEASKECNIRTICIAGGVSANSGLKERLSSLEKEGYKIFIPSLEYSTDNAAMIGITGYHMYKNSPNKEYFLRESFAKEGKPRLDKENF